MNACLKPEKLHRQSAEYPSLGAGSQAVSLPSWNYAWNRVQMGRLATGGCLYGGQTTAFWAPLRDLLHITNGPVGCGVYAQTNRPQVSDGFSGLNLSTDFQEKDVVFGGDNKLAKTIAEANQLFPHHRGVTLLSTCPIALIGDDVDAVARKQAQALGKPVVPVHCAGFRRGDGIGDTHATITGTWRDWAESGAEPPTPRDVVLLCREMNGAWRGIVRLLEQIGLRVTARWPAGGSQAETGRLAKGRLCISIEMEYWARQLQQQFGLPWVEADFLGPSATCESLRAIAIHFDTEVRQRTEDIIAAHAPSAQALVARVRRRLAGRLYFSFAPLLPREVRVYNEFGIRVGSALQGWQDREGRWRIPNTLRRHQEMTHAQMEALLRQAAPDLVGGLGQDGAALRKAGYAILDDRSHAELARAAIGFEGTSLLAREFSLLFDAPVRRLTVPPWRVPT